MLGSDVVVSELQRLAQRELEDLFRPRSKGGRSGRRRAGGTDRFFDLLANSLERDAERLERFRRESLPLVDQPEEDVLGSDEAVIEEARFFLGQDEHPASPISEPLEQTSLPCAAATCSGVYRSTPSNRRRAIAPIHGHGAR